MSSAVTAVLDLRERPTWDVAGLLAPDPEEIWGQTHLVGVSTLAELLMARTNAEDDEPVVTPGSVDATTGDVTTRRGRAAQRFALRVGTERNGARPDDVLVPQLGDGPCVLVGEQHQALSFVNFLALRAEERTTALWLWAALSSTRGRALRRSLAIGMTDRLPPGELLAAPVPSPPPLADPRYAHIAELHRVTSVSVASEGRTWWRVTSLPASGEWHRHLATSTPQVFDEGVPLGELGSIVTGRNPRRAFEQPRPGLLPVLNGRSVDGQRSTRWADAERGPLAEPGDVAVVEVGTRGRVAVVATPALAGTGVMLLKPHDRRHADAIAAYLRSEPAQALRATLITGYIPRLTRSTLAQLPVPDSILTSPVQAAPAPSPARPLSERLEQLLWS